jgi:hypothetical protein
MESILILDADSIAYKAAAANESKSITTTHPVLGVEHWDNRTKFRERLKSGTTTEDEYTIEDVQDPRHISYGQTLIKEMIKNTCQRAKVYKYEIYISGDNNFREVIPLPERYIQADGKSSTGGQYKSNRDDTIRPVQLKALRQWMTDELGAIPVHDREVDDISSIRAYSGYQARLVDKEAPKIIQATGDKDALGCTGWLFNQDKMTEPQLIQGLGELHREGKGIKGTGRMFFYFQTLFGDKVDGYRPVDIADIAQQKAGGKKLQFGEVAAYNILKDLKSDKECWQAIYNTYKSWYPEPTVYTAWNGEEHTKDAVDIMQLYVDCAHMQRFKDDRIICRQVLTKLGILSE